MATTDELLDVDGTGQQLRWWRFDVLDGDLTKIGELGMDALPPVEDDGALTISNDTNRAVMRTMTGFRVADGALFDEYRTILRPILALENGATVAAGTFVFMDGGRDDDGTGITFDAQMGDLSTWVDDESEDPIVLNEGAYIAPVIRSILESQGILQHQVTDSGGRAGTIIGWPPKTSLLQIVNELAALSGCLPLFFDEQGVAHVRPVPDLDGTDADVTYLDGRNIVATPIRTTSNAYTAPNRFIVYESGPTPTNIKGVYDLPAVAPNSFFHTGRYRRMVLFEQGLRDNTAANERARLLSVTDGVVLQRIAYEGMADPRHRTYSPIMFRGETYLEESTTMRLTHDGTMGHVLQRVWSEAA